MTSITASDTLYELDLHAVIRAGILADIHKKYIIWQLLKALKYLHSAGLRILFPIGLLNNGHSLQD
jgi:mitogen-activated protein kinase 15